MKKALAILLCTFILGTFAGCAGGENGGESIEDELEDILNGTITDEFDEPNEIREENQEVLGEFKKGAGIEETVLYNEGDILIKALGLTYDEYSAELNLEIENNTDKDLQFLSGTLGYSCNAINNFMLESGYLNCDVSAGKKAVDRVVFDYSDLMIYGIDEIAKIEMAFDISDDDFNRIYTGACPIETSASSGYDYSADHYQATITSKAAMNTYSYSMLDFKTDIPYDENGVKLLSSGILKNKDGDISLFLEFENNGSDTVKIGSSGIKINGIIACTLNWSSVLVAPGHRGIESIELTSVLDRPFWNIYGINDLGSVEVALTQYPEEGMNELGTKEIVHDISDVTATYNSDGTELYNNNGVRIVLKDIVAGQDEYDSDYHMLLLAENNGGEAYTIDDEYDSLSVNGYMADYTLYSLDLGSGESGIIDVDLWASSLEDLGITSVEDIHDIEMTINLSQGWDTIDSQIITVVN